MTSGLVGQYCNCSDKQSNMSEQPFSSEDDVSRGNPFGDQTVNDVVIQLVEWFGPEAVRQAVKRHAKFQSGRRSQIDIESLVHLAEVDALEWLDGYDPFKLRSNYSVAKLMASKNPGQSFESTKRRIMKELAEKRKTLAFDLAIAFSLEEYPYTKLLQIEETVSQLNARSHPSTLGFIGAQRAKLDRYRELFGDPAPYMTWEQIGKRLREYDFSVQDQR